MKAPTPHNETARLQALQQLRILDTPAEAAFDALTEIAAHVSGASFAALTLIDRKRQWFKSTFNFCEQENSRDDSFCSHAILTPQQLTYIPDARADQRTADNPLVTCDNGIRFYAGAPLVLHNELALGTLCVFDTQPLQLNEVQQKTLRQLADQAVLLMNSRLLQQQSAEQNLHLQQEKDRIGAIIDGTNMGTWEWNVQTGTTVYNTYWYSMLGMTPVEHSDISIWQSRVHPEDVAVTGEILEQHFAGTRAFFDARFRMRHQQGHWVWIHAVGRVMAWTDEHKPLLMFGTHRDITQERAQQQEMQRTRSHLQAIIDSSTEAALISTDVQGVIQLFNPGAERLLGYRAEELVGTATPALLHDPEEIRARAAQLSDEYQQPIDGFDVFVYKARHGASETRQWTYIGKQGERKQVRLSVSAIRTEQGEIRGYLGVAIDITQLEQLHHALLLSEQRHRSMLENLPGVVYRCINDAQWTMLFISDEVEKLTGYPARSFIRNQKINFAELQLAEDLPQVREVVDRELNNHARFSVEYRIRRANGSVRWVQELGRGIYDATGELLYIDGFIWDVTAQKEVQLALRAGEQKLSSLYQLAPLAILLSQFDSGDILSVNPQWCELSGLHGEPALPLPALLSFSSEQLEQRQQALAEHASFGPVELELQHADGQQIPVVLSEVLIQNASGTAQVWSIIQDITERRRVEQMKNQFVSMVSHELRTPLTAISGALGLLSGGALGALPEPMQPMLQIAGDNSEKLTQLINDLLDIDKLVAGKMQFELQDYAVRELLEQCVRHNQPYADKFGARIELTAGPDAVLALDPMRFHQIMANLLSNAAKFSPSGSVVSVRTAIQNNLFRISVVDQGPGIPDNFRDRIFEKFSQADAVDARQRGGTGLGLAIVKELTNRMGGQIGFDSETGKGSCFYLDFLME
ncbi:PAS domain S-box protein [Rheinheimera texasensis]|uniref:PAS domain S-box protein n=1 Tax=Rheinheimera texasensis TaxID=306205 RepID=UPI00068C1B81|nr:PAS domain S-box protein [Rheinheimera texasensis]